MFFRLPLLLFLSCLTFRSLAQVYEPGWLVRSNGDTLRGEIENNFWREAPTVIIFRPSATGASRQFQPRQLQAFGLRNGRYFRREALPIDYAADVRLGSLPLRSTTDIRSDSLLAEVLVDGPATLWRVVLPSTTHFLLRLPGSPVLDMSQRQYRQPTPGGSWATVDGNNYRDLLPIYVASCPLASKVAAQALFTAEALAAVADLYNAECGGGKPSRRYLSAASESRRVALVGGVLAGVRYNHFTAPTYPDPRCIDCQTHPFGGLYAELLLPNRRAAVYGELSVSTFRGNTLNSPSFSNIFDYQGWVGTARLGMRAFFPISPRQQLLVGLGYELNRILQAERVDNGETLLTDFLNFQHTTLIPALSVGWRQQRATVTVDGQLYRRDDFSATSTLIGTDYSLRLGLAYRLGRHPDQRASKSARP